jgi:predicted Rossmann-fold nucleotide-binding protein
VALVGDGYWDALLGWLAAEPARRGMIDHAQLGMLRRVQSVEDIIALVRDHEG